ncbi:MAG: hypothetical protein WKF54_03770 [Nocardioidaceae bacterium]
MSDNETTRDGSSPVARFLKAHVAAILLMVLVAIFIAQNTSRTSLDFLWLSFDSDLWFVLLVTTVVGFLIGALAARRRARRTS